MCSFRKCLLLHSGLHINHAAEFVSMESLLGNTPEHHHPLYGRGRLLYLGIGCRQPANAGKLLRLSGFDAVIVRNGECE